MALTEEFTNQPDDEARWHWVAAQQRQHNIVQLYLGHQTTYIMVFGVKAYFDHPIGQESGVGVLLSALGIHGDLVI